MNDDELTPTTGVYSGSDLAWENMPDDGIDLDYEEALAEGADPDELEYWDGGSTVLHGDWKLCADGQYEPDSENPNAEFALIYNANENTAQVVWSRTVRYGQPASPCYPGQVDARTDDPTEPEGAAAAAVPVEQIFCTAPRRRCVPYYALPGWAQRGDE